MAFNEHDPALLFVFALYNSQEALPFYDFAFKNLGPNQRLDFMKFGDYLLKRRSNSSVKTYEWVVCDGGGCSPIRDLQVIKFLEVKFDQEKPYDVGNVLIGDVKNFLRKTKPHRGFHS
jgi:hypothetical protein